MTLLAAFDHTNINNLDPNLVPNAVANSALRKTFLDQVAAEFDLIIAAVNTPASATSEGSMSIADKVRLDTHIGFGGTSQHPVADTTTAGFMSTADKLKLNSIIGTSIPVYSIPVDTEWAVGNFKWINVASTGALELREY